MRLKLEHFWLVAVVLALGCQARSGPTDEPVDRDVHLVPDSQIIESVVPRNATLESLLRQEQIPSDLTPSLVEAVRSVFNPRELNAGRSYWIVRGLDGLFREFRYQIDADNVLKVVFKGDAPEAAFDATVETLPKEYETAAISATISEDHNSLIGALEAQGENIQVALKLAQIFSGEVDFNSELHLGDQARLLYQRATRNGEFVGYGDILAAILTVGDRRIAAFRYVDADGGAHWYDEQGRSLRRQFLKSPFDFNPRVTSAFSYNRFHPVHGYRRAHLGVDFGAPIGTPVKAVASGVVELAGWNGEAGRMIRIRHTGGYKTAYLHLSGFASGIRAGAHVEQGDVIGRVGMTGTATGPHLDYRVMKNGTYINPLTAFRDMPAGDPIAPSELADFERQRDAALAEMGTSLDGALASTAGSSSSLAGSR